MKGGKQCIRRSQRSGGDEAVYRGGRANGIICLYDSQPDLTLLNHNVPTHCHGADAHTHLQQLLTNSNSSNYELEKQRDPCTCKCTSKETAAKEQIMYSSQFS